jgi:hypothetical protein
VVDTLIDEEQVADRGVGGGEFSYIT